MEQAYLLDEHSRIVFKKSLKAYRKAVKTFSEQLWKRKIITAASANELITDDQINSIHELIDKLEKWKKDVKIIEMQLSKKDVPFLLKPDFDKMVTYFQLVFETSEELDEILQPICRTLNGKVEQLKAYMENEKIYSIGDIQRFRYRRLENAATFTYSDHTPRQHITILLNDVGDFSNLDVKGMICLTDKEEITNYIRAVQGLRRSSFRGDFMTDLLKLSKYFLARDGVVYIPPNVTEMVWTYNDDESEEEQGFIPVTTELLEDYFKRRTTIQKKKVTTCISIIRDILVKPE